MNGNGGQTFLERVWLAFSWAAGPTRGLRDLAVRALLMLERRSRPETALRFLLRAHEFVESEIDLHCVRWGNGVHVKHEIMTGIHSFFYERVPPGSHVLDVGCGIGAVAHAVATHTDARVTAVDFSAASLEFAKAHFPHERINYVSGDVTGDLAVQAVDVVLLSSVLEHLDDRRGFIGRLLRRFPTARFLIRVPTCERSFLAPLKRRLGLFSYSDPTHRLEYTVESFRAEMDGAGLRIRHLEVRWGDLWAECEATPA